MFDKIRKAEVKDIEKLLGLLHQIREFHCDFRPDIFVRGCIKYSEEELEDVLTDESRIVFVAVNENDEAIAHLFLKIKNISSPELVKRKELYIDDICVDENERCQGIGKMLLEKAQEIAKELDCDFLTLNLWAGNDSAERLYKNFGLKPRVTTLEKRLK